MQSREQPPGAVASENHPALIAVPAANMPLKHRKTSPRSALKILGVSVIFLYVELGHVLVEGEEHRERHPEMTLILPTIDTVRF